MKVMAISDTELTATNAPVDASTQVYAAGTPYAVGAVVKHFVAGLWMKYRALQPCTGKTPPDYVGKTLDAEGKTVLPYWVEIGATNEWAAVDGFGFSRTVGQTDTPLTFTLAAASRNGLALMELRNVLSVRIVQTYAPTGDVVLDVTRDMVRTDVLGEVGSWWDYYFGQRFYAATLWVDLVPWTNSTVSLTLTPVPGCAPEVGLVACGAARWIGSTLYGCGPELGDYSWREVDEESGIARLKQGRRTKRLRTTLIVPAPLLDQVWRHVDSLTGQGCVWTANQGDADFDSLVAFGFVQDFQATVPGPTSTECSLLIGGLI